MHDNTHEYDIIADVIKILATKIIFKNDQIKFEVWTFERLRFYKPKPNNDNI